MISIDDYFGPWLEHEDVTPEILANAEILLAKVNDILNLAFEDGVDFETNPRTHSSVAGEKLGGFRPRDTKVGAAKSSHKEGKGIDIYDPYNSLDRWCMQNVSLLREYDLTLEHPDDTPKWCHLSSRTFPDGRVVFHP